MGGTGWDRPTLRRAMYQLGRGDHFIYDGGGCRHRRLSR